jgi:hypothetical protein
MRVEMLKSGKREENKAPAGNRLSGRVKFEIYGEEMIQKKVKPSGPEGGFTSRPIGWIET